MESARALVLPSKRVWSHESDHRGIAWWSRRRGRRTSGVVVVGVAPRKMDVFNGGWRLACAGSS